MGKPTEPLGHSHIRSSSSSSSSQSEDSIFSLSILFIPLYHVAVAFILRFMYFREATIVIRLNEHFVRRSYLAKQAKIADIDASK